MKDRMQLKTVLVSGISNLTQAGVPAAISEAESLIAHCLGVKPTEVRENLACTMPPAEHTLFSQLVVRRVKGEPLEYLLGYAEFMGLKYCVDRRVSIPWRPTETLVHRALELIREMPIRLVADVGTGCGCIAISIAIRSPHVKVYGVDTSVEALEVAKLNCETNGAGGKVLFLQSDLLDELPEPVDLIVANLPYGVPSRLDPHDLKYQPVIALDGGPDGLSCLRRLLAQMNHHIRPGGVALLEIESDLDKSRKLMREAERLLPDALVRIHRDEYGEDRIVEIRYFQRNKFY